MKEAIAEKLKQIDRIFQNHLVVLDRIHTLNNEALALLAKEPCKKCGGSGHLPIKDGGINIGGADNENYLGLCPSCQPAEIIHAYGGGQDDALCGKIGEAIAGDQSHVNCPDCLKMLKPDLAAEVREFIEFHGRQLKLWEEVEFCRCFSPSLKTACSLLDRLLEENAELTEKCKDRASKLIQARLEIEGLEQAAEQIKDLLEGKK